MMDPNPVDFEAIFRAAPLPSLVLAADAPRFTIKAASNSYLDATMTKEEDLVGRPLFEVFPDNPTDRTATGVQNLRASLQRVLSGRMADVMPVQRYDIPRRRSVAREFEERHWSPRNVPVLDGSDCCRYLLHQVEDVTAVVRAGLQGLLSFMHRHRKLHGRPDDRESRGPRGHLARSLAPQYARHTLVHLLLRDERGDALADEVLPIDRALDWLNESSPDESRWAEVYGKGTLLFAFGRDAASRWSLRL
jgi:hypothetical protein